MTHLNRPQLPATNEPTQAQLNPIQPKPITYLPGHIPKYKLPWEVKCELQVEAVTLHSLYPDCTAEQLEGALDLWLIAAIHDLTKNAVMHVHSGNHTVAIQRHAFQQIIRQIQAKQEAAMNGFD